MTERAQRRLAAIVSADVAGYSRLMGQDERGTLAALKAHRTELIDDAIARHGGRTVKTTGDGCCLSSLPLSPPSNAVSRFRMAWPNGTLVSLRTKRSDSASASELPSMPRMATQMAGTDGHLGNVG